VRLEGLGHLKNPKETDNLSRKNPDKRISKLIEGKKGARAVEQKTLKDQF
jgi:hypothetical protein